MSPPLCYKPGKFTTTGIYPHLCNANCICFFPVRSKLRSCVLNCTLKLASAYSILRNLSPQSCGGSRLCAKICTGFCPCRQRFGKKCICPQSCLENFICQQPCNEICLLISTIECCTLLVYNRAIKVEHVHNHAMKVAEIPNHEKFLPKSTVMRRS